VQVLSSQIWRNCSHCDTSMKIGGVIEYLSLVNSRYGATLNMVYSGCGINVYFS